MLYFRSRRLQNRQSRYGRRGNAGVSPARHRTSHEADEGKAVSEWFGCWGGGESGDHALYSTGAGNTNPANRRKKTVPANLSSNAVMYITPSAHLRFFFFWGGRMRTAAASCCCPSPSVQSTSVPAACLQPSNNTNQRGSDGPGYWIDQTLPPPQEESP